MRVILVIIPTNLVRNSLFFPLFSLHKNQKQEIVFRKVWGLVTKNISILCLWQVVLYFKRMPNLIDFYKGILLHDILVRINLSWCVDFWDWLKTVWYFAGTTIFFSVLETLCVINLLLFSSYFAAIVLLDGYFLSTSLIEFSNDIYEF